MSEQERVLFVHAHPDDETLATGGTLATLVDRGAWVTLVTCTRGEEGEVIPQDLQHLLASKDALADAREHELRAALDALGVTDHRYLGDSSARWPGRAPRRYVDSGMRWGASGAEARDSAPVDALTSADFGEVASDVAAVIADIHPDVVVSYNDAGGYGHPDHVRVAQAARRAAEVYGIPFFAIEPRDSAAEVTMSVDVSDVLERKRAALRAHRTQVAVAGDGATFELSNGVSQPVESVERFRRVHHEVDPAPTPFPEQSLALRGLTTAVGFVIGVAAGALLTVAHQASFELAGVTIPAGVVAGLLIVAALLTGMRLVFETRIVPGAAALGLLLAIGLLSMQSSGGSVLVPATTAGYVWTFGPTLIALVVLGWPRLPPRARDKIIVPSEVKGSLPQ